MSKINFKKIINSKILFIFAFIIYLFLFIYYLYFVITFLWRVNNSDLSENFPIEYSTDDYDDDYDNIKYSKSRYVRSNRKRAPKQYY